MLTRLQVSGFKNLVDVDVYFGPFTCIAGANGVGKSNLFDAIRFLSALADRPLVEAALSVRDEGGRAADVRSLFHQIGDQPAHEMTLEAEMITPETALDDFGQEARASITFLRYKVTLALRQEDQGRSPGSLELLHEELTHITIRDANKHLLFPHSASQWRKSAVSGERRTPYFISTDGTGSNRVIRLHQDGGSSGRPLSRQAATLPRTVLSAASAAESPTALLARREMQSWRLLQLEPSALRKPDELAGAEWPSGVHLGSDGSHLAATLYHLARSSQHNVAGAFVDEAHAYGQVANRLSELIDDVQSVSIDRDEKRELLTLYVTDRNGASYPARALSDGTLRFLALSVLALEQDSSGLICLEEPENGIHPGRIPALLRLLQAIATDANEQVSPDNPLRQVIISTHSPAVVSQVPDDSLIVAELKNTVRVGQQFKRVGFSALPDTWRMRASDAAPPVAKGKLLDYLNPVPPHDGDSDGHSNGADGNGHRVRRVIDRPDLQLLLPFMSSVGE